MQRFGPVVAALAAVLALAGCASAPPRPQPQDAVRPEATAPTTADEMAPAAAPTTVPAGNAQPADDDVLEITRRSVREGVEWVARSVDRWFGDKPFEEGGQVRDGRISIDLLWREDDGFDPKLRFRARFRLPNVERFAYAFIGRDNDREVVADVPGVLSARARLEPETREEQAFFAGLGTTLLGIFDARLGFNVNQKVYAQLRYRPVWTLGERDRIGFGETAFWNLDEGFGSTTTLWYEHDFSPTLLLRWTSGATISQESEEFGWASNLGLYKVFPGLRTLTLEALVSGQQGSGLSEYGPQLRWGQPIYKDWLLGEIRVGHFWQYEDGTPGRQRQWAVGAGVKMLF